jgi:precorrin-2 methylase
LLNNPQLIKEFETIIIFISTSANFSNLRKNNNYHGIILPTEVLCSEKHSGKNQKIVNTPFLSQKSENYFEGVLA